MLTRILNYTAIRMAIRYSLIYGAILIAVVIVYNWTLQSPVDNEIKTALLKERDATQTIYQENGLEGLIGYIKERVKKKESYLYLLVDKTGTKMAGNLRQLPEDFDLSDIKVDEIYQVLYDDQILPLELFEDEANLPTTTIELENDNRLLIAHPTQRGQILREINEYLIEFAIPVLLLSSLIGVTLAYAVLRRINTISHTAKEIMEGDITRRIPLSGKNDEFDALSSRLNTMMDRIQKLIEGTREVSDNVAHDLRSPLTRLRNSFEVTLLEDRSNEEYRETLNNGIQDVESLLKTFNSLLSIAQAESGNHRSRWKEFTLNDLLVDMVEFYEPLADEKKQTLTFGQNDEIKITASRDLLAQATSNLIENAIKYTSESGKIHLELEHENNTVTISVSDTGPGIPANEREHVLERFVRLDNSRHTEGNGLGLSLVKAVCELHHGTLHFSEANPGLIVTMRLPLRNYENT